MLWKKYNINSALNVVFMNQHNLSIVISTEEAFLDIFFRIASSCLEVWWYCSFQEGFDFWKQISREVLYVRNVGIVEHQKYCSLLKTAA